MLIKPINLPEFPKLSPETDWLAMLEKATSYADLQAAFERMTAESMSTNAGDTMVASIDEAIRRIELERGRDQQELEGLSADYESFKQEQAGVIGWFKRKLPFTETRKQELGHRDALSDQAAEILGDNFIIARAQMLKERIAPEHTRRVGYRPEHWRNQFRNAESLETIREYGKVVYELGKELVTSKLFIDTVTIDIDGFATARFVSKEDQLRSSHDLTAARGELKELADELQAKANIRNAGLVTLKGLLIAELSEKDSRFRETNQHFTDLSTIQEKQPSLAKLLSERSAITKDFITKLSEKEALPERREKIEKTAKSLEQEYDHAEKSRLRAASDFEEPSRLYNAAVQEAQQAKLALSGSRRLYDAYVAEQAAAGAAEVASERDFDNAESNVVAEYRRLEAAATQAGQLVSQRTPAFELAKSAHDRAVNDAKSLREKLESVRRELEKLDEQESELQKQLVKAKQNLDSTQPAIRVAVEAYLEAARKLSWWAPAATTARVISSLLDDDSFPNLSAPKLFRERTTPPAGMRGHLVAAQKNAECLEKAVQAIEQDQKAAKAELERLSKLRTEAIRNRGQMLLEQSVLTDLALES